MFTLKEVAEKIEGQLVGNQTLIINSVDDISLASKGSIAFAFLPNYKMKVKSSSASAFIVLNENDLYGNSGIIVNNPYKSMIKLLEMFDSRPVVEYCISENSIVDKSVELPNDLHLGAFSVIEKDVVIGNNVYIGNGVKLNPGSKIGDNSILYDNVVLYDNSIIGKNTIIHSGSIIGCDGFGYHTVEKEHHKIPHIKSVIIGDNVEIGASCTIDRGSVQNTIISNHCKLDNQVHIAHNVQIGKGCLLAGGVFIGGSTHIKDYVTIAGKSDIGPHIEIGQEAVIAARSCVLKSLPGKEIYAGNPARTLKEKQKRDAISTRVSIIEKKLRKNASKTTNN